MKVCLYIIVIEKMDLDVSLRCKLVKKNIANFTKPLIHENEFKDITHIADWQGTPMNEISYQMMIYYVFVLKNDNITQT